MPSQGGMAGRLRLASSSCGTSCFLVVIVFADKQALACGGLSVYTKFCTPSVSGGHVLGGDVGGATVLANQKITSRVPGFSLEGGYEAKWFSSTD